MTAPPASDALADEQIESVLRLPVADGEDVAFYLLYGCQGVSPEVEAIMVREVARTILAAAPASCALDALETDAMAAGAVVRDGESITFSVPAWLKFRAMLAAAPAVSPPPAKREPWICLLCKSGEPGRHGTLDDGVTTCPNGVEVPRG